MFKVRVLVPQQTLYSPGRRKREPVLELFLVGSVGFWILIAAEIVVLLALTEYEKPVWSLVSLVAVGLLLKFFGGYSVVDLVLSYPKETAASVFGYFLLGTLWAVAKWYFFVRTKREVYLAAKEEYLKGSPEKHWNRERGGDPKEEEVSWENSFARGNLLNSKKGIAPLARDHKVRILQWMAYWPWSAIWTLVHDAVKRIYKTIYENIHKLLQSISDNAFKDVK